MDEFVVFTTTLRLAFYKHSGHMLSSLRETLHPTGIAYALSVIRDAENIQEKSMAYMTIANTPTIECGLFITSFLNEYGHEVDEFFKNKLRRLALAYSFHQNCIYRRQNKEAPLR